METVEAVRMFKMMADPPPTTVIGLSNISNGALPEVRPLINRVMMVMAMGAGLDSAIADPLDNVQNEWIRIAEQRDESTPAGQAHRGALRRGRGHGQARPVAGRHGRPGAGRALEDLPHAHQRDALRGLVSAALSEPGGTRSEHAGQGDARHDEGPGRRWRRPGPSRFRSGRRVAEGGGVGQRVVLEPLPPRRALVGGRAPGGAADVLLRVGVAGAAGARSSGVASSLKNSMVAPQFVHGTSKMSSGVQLLRSWPGQPLSIIIAPPPRGADGSRCASSCISGYPRRRG